MIQTGTNSIKRKRNIRKGNGGGCVLTFPPLGGDGGGSTFQLFYYDHCSCEM